MDEIKGGTAHTTKTINNNQEQSDLILEKISEFHAIIKKYSVLRRDEKPLIVGSLLLALKSVDNKAFFIENLTGNEDITDGTKVFQAVTHCLEGVSLLAEEQKEAILGQLIIIKNLSQLNKVDPQLNKTLIRVFIEFLHEHLFENIVTTESPHDLLGILLNTEGNDGSVLGIVLTPEHIRELFCELLNIQPTDIVLDPCTGTGGFLLSAMYYMLRKANNKEQQDLIRQKQLFGIEIQPYMATIASISLILSGAAGNNIFEQDFALGDNKAIHDLKATIGVMNPPYSQGTKTKPELYEIKFIENLLNSLIAGGKAAIIVPQSTMVGKTNAEKAAKADILKKHTLEGVITLNENTFFGVGTMTCIAVFTTGTPHPKDKKCKFIDFRDDGYETRQHRGLVETEQAPIKKKHLLDVWFGRATDGTKFCIKTTIEPDDEWLHSFYYFDDSIPTDADFDKVISDYLTFEFSMVMQGREYLFEQSKTKKK